MKVLLCHNYYQQPGGEDVVFAEEGALLERHGHEVIRFTIHNDEVKQLGALKTARLAIWNRKSYRRVGELIRRERPDVMHCHNTFPLLSPAIYYAAQTAGVAVVQALHNYRLLCPNALFLREGRACEDCLGRRFAWPAIQHGCYRGSRAGSAVVASMSAYHHLRGTWSRAVDRYYALTEFSRQKFVEGGFPRDKVCVKPNFAYPQGGPGDGGGDYCLFVGRLSLEKGIRTLLEVYKSRAPKGLQLKIVGDGPLAEEVRSATASQPDIQWLGAQPHDKVMNILGSARCLVVPSVCYETFGKTIVEAFAMGTPVVASRLGAPAELVGHERTGLLFEPGDASDLTTQLRRFAIEEEFLRRMRDAAHQEYLGKYTPQRNYQLLMEIYAQALRVSLRESSAASCAGGSHAKGVTG